MPPISGSSDFYSGSRLLTPFTGILSIDQVNFLACQLFALAIGFVFRTKLDPRTTSANVRHTVEVALGIGLVYFCFGSQIVHLFAHATIGYVLMFAVSNNKMPWVVFVVTMGYLSIAHIYRMILDYGGFTLDITGPLMMSVQKITMVAFAVHDGTKREEKDLTPMQKKNALKEIPDALSFFSYIFCFHNVMVGPFVFYNDYIAFIDGSIFNPDNDKTPKAIPSPLDVLGKKLLVTVVLAALMMAEPMVINWQNLNDKSFLASSHWLFLMCYMLVCMSMHRPMYYFAWKLGEVVNNSCGLGFKGYDVNGDADWSLLNNVDIYKLEVSNSLKLNIESWNILTAVWLRYSIYERMPPSIATWAVFTISAFWHGFYPGYYIAFLTAALFTTAARLVRRNIRPFFLQSSELKFLYDCITFFFTRFANAYFVRRNVRPLFQQSQQMQFVYDCITFTFTRFANTIMVTPFVLLEVKASLTAYTSVYWCLHIPSALVIVYFSYIQPMLKPKPKQKTEKVN